MTHELGVNVRDRLDRIILKKNPHWKVSHIEIIGKEQIQNSKKKMILFPSDHFG
jgi:hypothetical protein